MTWICSFSTVQPNWKGCFDIERPLDDVRVEFKFRLTVIGIFGEEKSSTCCSWILNTRSQRKGCGKYFTEEGRNIFFEFGWFD